MAGCAACSLLPGCNHEAAPRSTAADPIGASATSPVRFAFESLDDRPVSSDALAGKPALVAFITTGSLLAQAQVDYLVAMDRRDGGRASSVLVALDPPSNRELVELYRKALHVGFPVAMADDATRSGDGPFGDVTAVPVIVVLDRSGRVVRRIAGRVARPDELRTALAGL